MRYLSVCSGIEAASVAWHLLGWKPAAFSEIEAFPRAVLAHRFPGIPLHGDFTTIKGDEYGSVDLLVGGTPCQDFSVAGLRAGLSGERGNLTLEFLRLAQRLRSRWLVWENVPGVLSQDGGRAFGAILGGMVELGYGFAYRVLDAQFIRVDGLERAVPQRRRRVFVVGYLGDWRRAAAVLFEREGLSRHSAPRRLAGQGFAHDVVASLVSSGRGVERAGETRGQDPVVAIHFQGTGSNLDVGGNVAATLQTNADRASGGAPCVAFGGNNTAGPISVATALNAHGGPNGRQDFESETFVVAPPLTSNPYGDHESREGLLVAHSLRGEGFDASEDGTGRGTPLVPVKQPYTLAVRGRECVPQLEARQDGTANAVLTPNGGRAGIGVGAIAFDTTQITSRENRCNPQAGDPCHPLAAGAHAPAIAFDARQSDVIQYGEKTGPLDTDAFTMGILQGWAVRRLTPLECERLQGFPDGWTDVPYRGKPASDGPRYKALGNSMAVNCMRWIGQRIAAVEELNAVSKVAAE